MPKKTALVRRPITFPKPAPAGPADPVQVLFIQLAKDKRVDVNKLERLIGMKERIQKREAEAAFNVAMSEAQAELQPIATDADNSQTHSRYASYEALDHMLRPIYTKHGFGLSFDTADSPVAEMVRVVCYCTHRDGHARTYRAEIPADGKGAKGGDVMTKTHAVGSAMSYGQRYLLKLIFNIAVRRDDDDGNAAGRPADQQQTSHYDAKGDTRFITQPQRQRLYTIATRAGRSKDEIKAFLKHKLDIDSSKNIRRQDYDAVCVAVEASGPLPIGREPGEDD